ncbi:MAG: NADH-quinone oxidoreductase subunit NuoK [Candidatus Omnitrophica bacterium]|nr:NADH-quinone oxidoreductase subunit NuoK [Candidatus Omnitrophota bacterium]
MIPLEYFTLLSAFLFCVGIYGALTRRNVIGILISIELILNAANINLVAFNKYLGTKDALGQIFSLFVIAIAAAASVVGLVLIIAIYRNAKTLFTDGLTLMKD